MALLPTEAGINAPPASTLVYRHMSIPRVGWMATNENRDSKLDGCGSTDPLERPHLMRRAIPAIITIVLLLCMGLGFVMYQSLAVPSSIDDIDPSIADSIHAYEVIDGTPLVVATPKRRDYLDTIDFTFPVKQWPPYAWELTGHWIPIESSSSTVTAGLTSQFGPKVVYGIIRIDGVETIELRRGTDVIAEFTPQSDGFIEAVPDARFGDTLVFLDDNDESLASATLRQS